MAFECQKNTKVALSKQLVKSPRNSSKAKSACSKFKGEGSGDQDREFAGEIKTEILKEALKPGSELGLCTGAAVSPALKLALKNEVAASGFSRSITDLPSALISEILNFLGPKELGLVSCVSTSLYKLASDHYVWKDFYCERWGLPMPKHVSSSLSDEKTWKELFVERECRSRIFLGQYTRDFLTGHTDAVRTVCVLASAKLIITSGYDTVVRMWDLEEGCSIASSRPLGCTIRAVAADRKLLVAGGTGGFIQYWNATEGHPHLFDLKGSYNRDTDFRLWGHEGPITSLALDITKIYSGSWDMTVRVWDRALMSCVMVLRHSDWIWSLSPHGTTLATVSGSDVYIWDTTDETLISFIPQAHDGSTYAVARSHAGDFLFTGGEDGAIHMFEMSNCVEDGALKVATWAPHSGAVHSLAFEFPWLVSASADGKLSLIDVRKLLKNSKRSLMKRRSNTKRGAQPAVEPPQRVLHGSGSSLFCVSIGGDRIICGGEEYTVKVWDFSQALEKEKRARVQRGIRLENRMRQRKLQLEMSGSMNGKNDKCSLTAKKNPINGDRGGVWYSKRGVSGKLEGMICEFSLLTT